MQFTSARKSGRIGVRRVSAVGVGVHLISDEAAVAGSWGGNDDGLNKAAQNSSERRDPKSKYASSA